MRLRRGWHFEVCLFAVLILATGGVVYTQSTDQNFPTPVTSNEILGTIKARDIGDGRLTRYFYAFDGGQGDIFINVVTKNLSGDIDVFSADTLRPLTKIVIFPDSGPVETGRLVYLRKGERLILRIEGRTPNDDPATFRIKFGGSFIAIQGQTEQAAPVIKDADGRSDAGIRVNSVGTIIEVTPKNEPTKPKAEIPASKADTERVAEKKREDPPKNPASSAKVEKPTVVVKPAPEVATVFGNKNTPSNADNTKKTESKAAPPASNKPKTKPANPADEVGKSSVKEIKPDPLASIRLIVLMKSGESIEKPMSEIVKFSVDKGILTVIAKDGKINRYSILDVAKVTIE